MIALAVAQEAGADAGRALAALAGVSVPGGRGRVLEAGGLTVIDDTYNANPASLRWGLKFAHWLAARPRRPPAVGGGSVFEVGGGGGRLHAAAATEILGLRP